MSPLKTYNHSNFTVIEHFEHYPETSCPFYVIPLPKFSVQIFVFLNKIEQYNILHVDTVIKCRWIIYLILFVCFLHTEHKGQHI